MTNKAEETITIDDVSYVYNDLPQDVKNILAEMTYCRDTAQQYKVELQRLDMMERGYTTALAEAMKQVTD